MARCREAMPPPGVHRPDMPGRLGGGDDGSDELDVFAAERYFNGDDAPWCALSSSSFSSVFRTETTHEHDRSVAATATAATSSSEASWNSLPALLPDRKVLAASPSVVEAEPRGAPGSERPRGKPLPPSSHLRRWLLVVARCACVHGDGEESLWNDGLGNDEDEDDDVVRVGEEKHTDGAGELFERTESEELAVVRVRPGRSLDEFLAGKAAFSPVQVQLAGDGHRRSFNSATTAALLHGQRRKSFETLQPVGGILRSALASTKKQDSASTIVAGNTTRDVVGGGGGGNLCDTNEDDAALSELGCAYPPSEASVVWSVVTAEGAASCNFSSAASGYYYHFNGDDDGAVLRAARRSNWRRRSVVSNGAGFLTCMGDKAVNAVEPARWPEIEPVAVGRSGARSHGRGVQSTLM